MYSAPIQIVPFSFKENGVHVFVHVTASGKMLYYCDANTATATVALYQYLSTKGIGIANYAWDFAGNAFGSAFYGFPAVPSSFANNAQCGSVGYGPGKVIESWYPTGTVPATPL